MTNAVKGLKHVIQHKEKFIQNLDTMTKDWKDEWAITIIDAVKDSVTKDIGSFEWILGEIQSRKITKISHNSKNRK